MGNLNAAALLEEHWSLFSGAASDKPILDLACGGGHNGIFLASRGFRVVLADRSDQALQEARRLADQQGVKVRTLLVDLEKEGADPLGEEAYQGILVFRYLHRPLIPFIQKALVRGGVLMYETYTVDQPRFGRPRNPAFLLRPGELRAWFDGWHILHHFEGLRENPTRAVAQIICRKPGRHLQLPDSTES